MVLIEDCFQRVFKQSNKPLDYGFKIKAALDTARAMLFLHENRVLHRDLKLDNLLVCIVAPVLVSRFANPWM
jgi:serine/threonine protein kinase